MLKIRSLIAILLCVFIFPVQAHFDKKFDVNGGHYDDYGEYHCHNYPCDIAPNRYVRQRNALSSRASDRSQFYNEDDWPYWEDLDNDCQDARAEILIQSSQTPVSFTNPRNCQVREGLWVDPHTGEQFTRAADLQIDHIISTIYADAANGYQWTDQARLLFANEPQNLIPVSRASYRKKRQRGINAFQPEGDYLCTYASTWRTVSELYDLELYLRDKNRMNRILDECDIDMEETEGDGVVIDEQ